MGAPAVRTIVGLEIHVQLRTRTKLFCACPLMFDAPPNSCVCQVCLGHPGALPVMNRQAVELAVLTGLALNCRIAPHTKWDRKSYFYPDLPKGYQISQYDLPIAANGYFEFEVVGQLKRVRIRRAHLEEDAGKNIHDAGGGTLVDLNRAGTPLLEIVTEPDIASAEDAFVFCTELQRLVRHLGVSEASMQKGHMRFEPNVNLVIEEGGCEFRTPIAEIKNINSFRFARQAIEYEAQRQFSQWQADRDYVLGKRPNENRGWNAERGITEYQRGKEAAHDYRYFPDPDLVPVELALSEVESIRAKMPEHPLARRRRLVAEHKVALADAEIIVDDRATADFFDRVVALGAPATTAAKQMVNTWIRWASDRGVPLEGLGVSAERVAELARMTGEGVVSSSAAAQVAEAMLSGDESPRAIAERLGLIQVRDSAATQKWVEDAFAQNAQAVQDAQTNPKKAKAAAGFLRGQVMKLSGGKADPKLVGELIEKRLNQGNE
jgi:aspartyl-tRNA(Asn)/glutamyl-tRNA(Gln) amidotransferase subunit B